MNLRDGVCWFLVSHAAAVAFANPPAERGKAGTGGRGTCGSDPRPGCPRTNLLPSERRFLGGIQVGENVLDLVYGVGFEDESPAWRDFEVRVRTTGPEACAGAARFAVYRPHGGGSYPEDMKWVEGLGLVPTNPDSRLSEGLPRRLRLSGCGMDFVQVGFTLSGAAGVSGCAWAFEILQDGKTVSTYTRDQFSSRTSYFLFALRPVAENPVIPSPDGYGCVQKR
jgi:hypothetical protein